MINEDSKRIISELKCVSDSTWSNRQPDIQKNVAENSQLLPEGSFCYLLNFILNKGLFTRRIYCCHSTAKPATDKLIGFPVCRTDMEKVFCSLIICPWQFWKTSKKVSGVQG